MKLSISNIGWNADEDSRVYNLMKKYGYTGLEIAPTRIIKENPYANAILAKEKINKLDNDYSFKICSMQSILFGRSERLFGNPEERESLKSYMEKAIIFAREIKCKNLVFGSPKNRVIEKKEDFDIAISFFKEIGDFAYENQTILSIEPNPTIYGTNFINKTMDAFSFVRTVNSKGFKVNLDFGTVIANDEKVSEIHNSMDLVNHVHISEPNLVQILERRNHIELADILLSVGYNKYVSIEMKRDEKNSIVNIEKALVYVSKVFGG